MQEILVPMEAAVVAVQQIMVVVQLQDYLQVEVEVQEQVQ